MPRDERRSSSRPTRRREQVIRTDPERSQLHEASGAPSGPVGSFAGSPSEFSADEGAGGSTLDRYGGPLRRRDDPPNARSQGTGREGGFSTLGGGTYYGEGSSLDAPGDGDRGRGRNVTGTDSGARGREGPVYEGEHIWGESQQERQRERVTGPHAGRGPHSRRRSDETIRGEIRELLKHHPDVDAGDVEVLIEGGEVTLQGSVEDRDVRWLIEDLVQSVSGVSLVHNRLRVAGR